MATSIEIDKVGSLPSTTLNDNWAVLLIRGICETSFRAEVPNSSFAEVRMVLLIEPTHMEDEDERYSEECRVEGRRVSRQQQHADDTWITWARHLEPMSRATLKWEHASARKCDVWGITVHTLHRLQQIAISCNRSDYKKFFGKKKSSKFPLCVSWWMNIQNRSPCSHKLLIAWAHKSLTISNLWTPPVFIPLPPRGTGCRRRRMPPLVLIKENWCKSLFSSFTVRRCIPVSASRKSHRSVIGAFVPYLFSDLFQYFFYLSNSSEDGQ